MEEMGVCKVCELIDNDISIKKVKYCSVCGEYICEKCKPDLWKRGKAAIKQKIKKIL